jgi:hypothetical protein
MLLLVRSAVSACALVLALGTRDTSLAAGALLILATFSIVRGLRLAGVLLSSVLALAAPLLLVHGFLNPAYPAEGHLAGVLPWRPEGAWFALTLSLRMTLLFTALAVWGGLPRLLLVSLIVKSKLPPVVGMVLLQADSQMTDLRERIKDIERALLSRGLLQDSGWASRIKGLVAHVVPLVAISIIQAFRRASARERLMGGTARAMVAPVPLPAPAAMEWVIVAGLLASTVFLGVWPWHIS